MATCVAEYLGKRTDVDDPVIVPCDFSPIPKCPFSHDNICSKCKSHNEPICSVRKSDGTLWINCPNRLCTTKKDQPLSEYQISILTAVAQNVFDRSIDPRDVCVKREVKLQANEDTTYKADYIMTLRGGLSPFSGPDKLIVEMQGGGETSNTGKLTDHVASWRVLNARTNELLRTFTAASTLETNAWRRQQEQFIVKGNIAMKTWKGYGMAFCVGTLLYDYLMNKINKDLLPDLREHNWTLALLCFKEDDSQPKRPGPIPLCIDTTRMLYTNYQTFVQALINQGEPTAEAFKGEFLSLNNETVVV